ncbi:hypothetical protein BOTCAL_0086g00260 [Botryotinia calthae]|uniref:Uncharacterized protein n=1 Tax=Botryotinia calthae TaxID=38488 RepID=A0A4Y8D7Y2_9HELO|nr:hypothetical protein BOTCAL_0086g00260 [Botryotinia calthae]
MTDWLRMGDSVIRGSASRPPLQIDGRKDPTLTPVPTLDLDLNSTLEYSVDARQEVHGRTREQGKGGMKKDLIIIASNVRFAAIRKEIHETFKRIVSDPNHLEYFTLHI